MITFLLETPPNTGLGSYGEFFCNIVERTAEILPESPFTFASLAQELGDEQFNFMGKIILYDMLNFLFQLGGAIAIFKVFKTLPAKF